MPDIEIIDTLIGTGLSETALFWSFTDAEIGFLRRLISDFSLDTAAASEIIRGLYRFKKTLGHYVTLWKSTSDDLNSDQKKLAQTIFRSVELNLERNARRCFAKVGFFSRIRFLLQACKELGIPENRRLTYIRWLVNFPITPAHSIKEVLEHELFRSNLPHVYMHMAAGFVRRRVVDKISARHICGEYRTFLAEMNIPRAHARWFNRRYAGSAGSRQ